ncbi:MAG: cupin domain-containing protein [Agathobacter sp.]|nr:cupin domain-containing protein [Agathobacter sp.]
MNQPFTIETIRPIRDGMTVSKDSHLSAVTPVTFFSLGADTSISQESYDRMTMYIGASGTGGFLLGSTPSRVTLEPGQALLVPPKTLCGMETAQGIVYTEIILAKEIIMNNNVKTNEVFALKDLISYEEGSIANMDVVSNDTMKYVLMAFDKGTGLTPHRAPGNAIVFALDGKATIGYEGKDYELKAGECFRFEKNGLHSVTADERFKMALLLVLE